MIEENLDNADRIILSNEISFNPDFIIENEDLEFNEEELEMLLMLN